VYCGAGEPIFDGDQRICRYGPYPLYYEVDIVPPSGPKVIQVNTAPAGDQGLSADYTSGFSFSIGGEVDISGDDPNAGIAFGATWENDVTTTVPPLVIQAGDTGPDQQGIFTRYQYSTVGKPGLYVQHPVERYWRCLPAGRHLFPATRSDAEWPAFRRCSNGLLAGRSGDVPDDIPSDTRLPERD
jgi:hypothetical protein